MYRFKKRISRSTLTTRVCLVLAPWVRSGEFRSRRRTHK
uniref:Uncharacterized protein n=1 Tax=Anguilla anguilla TaxID=7936 RepID=A0A0E9PWZ6_ANGAN